MDQYEDLQKFREKTRMKSIRFVDFTKQNKEVNHGQWSIVQQLANNNAPLASQTSPDLTSQTLNTPLTNKAPDPVHLSPLTTSAHSTASATSLLKDVGMQLNRPEAFQTEIQSPSSLLLDTQAQPQYQPQPAVQTQPQYQPQPAVQAQPQLQPQPVVETQPQYQPQPDIQAQAQPATQSPTNFSHLFTAPVEDTPVAEKEASLQSLLKRIATCR